MARKDNRQARKNHVPTRLTRLVNLRKLGAPLWIIKTEQIALLLNSKGKKHSKIGSDFSKEQELLYQKYVQPLLDGDE